MPLRRLPDLKNWARTFHPELLKLESVRSAPEISPKVDRLLQLLEQEPLKGQKGSLEIKFQLFSDGERTGCWLYPGGVGCWGTLDRSTIQSPWVGAGSCEVGFPFKRA